MTKYELRRFPEAPKGSKKSKKLKKQRNQAAAKASAMFGERGNEEQAKIERQKRDETRKRYEIRPGKRMAALLAGEIDVSTLSVEELVRGQLKDKNGGFCGRPSKLIPREFHQAAIRELLSRGDQLLRQNYLDALEVFIAIMKNPLVKEAERLKAAQIVMERVAGKTPVKLEVGQEDPFVIKLQGIVATEAEAKRMLKEEQ